MARGRGGLRRAGPDADRRPRPRAAGGPPVDRRLRRRDDRGRRAVRVARRRRGRATLAAVAARAGTRALFQADGGIADPERGNAAHQRLARAAGAELLERARVAAIRDHGGELEVVLDDGGAFAAGAVVIAADAWTNDCSPRWARRCRCRHPRAGHPVRGRGPDPLRARALPDLDLARRALVLRLPDVPRARPEGRRGRRRPGDDGATRTFDSGPRLPRPGRAVPRAHLPGAIGRVAKTKTCLYTLTPDRDFVIDRLPGHPGVVVALGAAHAYKFAALFGELLADLALDPRAAARPPSGLRLFADRSAGPSRRGRRFAIVPRLRIDACATARRANLARHRAVRSGRPGRRAGREEESCDPGRHRRPARRFGRHWRPLAAPCSFSAGSARGPDRRSSCASGRTRSSRP